MAMNTYQKVVIEIKSPKKANYIAAAIKLGINHQAKEEREIVAGPEQPVFTERSFARRGAYGMLPLANRSNTPAAKYYWRAGDKDTECQRRQSG